MDIKTNIECDRKQCELETCSSVYVTFNLTLEWLFVLGGAYIRRGLSTEGNLRFKIDWASRIVRSKLTVFALFCCVFEGNFPSTSPWGAYIWRGDLTEGFCVTGLGGLYLEGLIFGILGYVSLAIVELYSHRICPS